MDSKLMRKLAKGSFWLGIIFVILALASVQEYLHVFPGDLSILALGVGSLLAAPKYYFRAKDIEERCENSGRVDYFERYRFAGLVGIGLVTIGVFIAELLQI